jgi:uncharacterized protein HemX
MARYRKTRGSAIGFGPVLKAVLLCALIAGVGVGYVWQKEQIDALSRQIAERGARLARLIDENQNRRRQLADLRSLNSVEARIKELNLGLAQPSPTQIWHLAEPSREATRQPLRLPPSITQIARTPPTDRARTVMSP